MKFSPYIHAFLGASSFEAMEQCPLSAKPADACAQLSSALPNRTSLPNSAEYAISNDYWSALQRLSPACFLYPESTGDVSTAIKLLASLSAPFTVKSGGHTAFAGGSSIQSGVTIDLVRLNEVTVWADRSTVSIGPGNRWGDVSAVLDKLQLGVVGGRVGQVGVSGLILGGGVSFFSNRRGWACDNVRAFEVVLVSGDVVVATPTEHSDLYWALRGGGGKHFGLVTRFDVEAFAQGELWRQMKIYPLTEPSTTRLIRAYVELGMRGFNEDLDSHNFIYLGDMPALGGSFLGNFVYHAKAPADPESVPAVFADITSVPGSLQTTTDNANVSARLLEISEQYGLRKGWHSLTVRLAPHTAGLLRDVVVPEFKAHVASLRATAAGLGVEDEALVPGMSWHVISTTTLRAMERNGGNAMGLRAEDGPFIHMNTIHTWSRPELDSAVEQGMADLVAHVEDAAKKKDLNSRFKYINYAGKSQPVYESYGAESHERLRKVAARYDPEGILKALWKGYFEL